MADRRIGWTGSGAIYDAVCGADSFCEFPAAQPDLHLHPDALSELTFIQEQAGPGRIWRQAREQGSVDTRLLWDLLRCHVLGLGGIGYTEHKSTNADILDLFGNVRAIAVLRDPRDVYADRKLDDLRHWRTAGRFSDFHESGMRRFVRYVNDPGSLHGRDIRLVTFEQFVQDPSMRDRLLAWFVPGDASAGISGPFNPVASAENIGIHPSILTPDESTALAANAEKIRQILEQLPGDQFAG